MHLSQVSLRYHSLNIKGCHCAFDLASTVWKGMCFLGKMEGRALCLGNFRF